MAKESTQAVGRENKYLGLDPLDILSAISSLRAQVDADLNPNDRLKQEYVDSVIAFQHSFADLSQDKTIQLSQREVESFSMVFTINMEKLSHKNILLPGKPEFQPKNLEQHTT